MTVVVDGAAQATRCCYSYSTDYTPTVHAVWPPAGPAGSAVTLYGYSNWMLDQDCTETQLTDGSPPSCIGSVMFNGYLCTPDAVSYVKGSFTRFSGAWLYRLTCKLPNPKQVKGAARYAGLGLVVSAGMLPCSVVAAACCSSFGCRSHCLSRAVYKAGHKQQGQLPVSECGKPDLRLHLVDI